MKYKFLQHKLFVNWVAPFAITALIFSLVRPAFAQIFEQDTNLAQYLAVNNVEVGSETVDGYQQVYYIFNGSKVFITKSSQNSTQAVSDGEYIAFSTAVNGEGQIFLYHIPSDTTVQITSSGTNLQPRLSDGKIVWEGWTEEAWQVFLFDGTSVRQLTSRDLSINPDIEGDQVAYASNNEQDEWRTVVYSLSSKQAVVKKNGLTARYPKFRNKQVVFELEEFLAEQEAKKQAEEASLSEISSGEPLLESSEEDQAGQAVPAEEPTEPPTGTEEEITDQPSAEASEPASILEEEPILPEEPTEPQTVAEQEIIDELEGEPLVQDEISEEDAVAGEEEPAPAAEPDAAPEPLPAEVPASEPEPQPEASPPPAQAPAPAPEPTPVEEPAPAPEPGSQPEPSPEPTPASTSTEGSGDAQPEP